jgi:hypothetical protein
MSVITKFAAFREKKKDKQMKETMATMVSSAVEEIKESTYFTTPTNGRGGGGISKTQFMSAVRRIAALEDNPSGGLTYIPLRAAGTAVYSAADFIFGINIIGVNAPGDVTIRLPQTLTTGTIVKIKDESLSAAINNITVETYLEV